MESVVEKITERFHDGDSSPPVKAVKSKCYRLFGREKPLHKVLGGGKCADLLLWRRKSISAGVLGGAIAVWFLFELLEYHLLTLLCHSLMLYSASLFLWSNASFFIRKSRPNIRPVQVPEKATMEITSALLFEINRGLASLINVAFSRDLKLFLSVAAGLWVLSGVGKWCNFITLVYTSVVLLFMIPSVYEKYEDEVDSFADKVRTEMKEQYRVVCKKVLHGQPGDVFNARKLD